MWYMWMTKSYPDFFRVNRLEILKVIGIFCRHHDLYDDIYQEFAKRIITQRVLEKFDEEKSTFGTYIHKHIEWTVRSWTRVNYNLILSVRDSAGPSTEEFTDMKKDFVSFLRWYMHNCSMDKRAGTKYRMHRNIRIMRYLLIGKSRVYIASRYGITISRIGQILTSIKADYQYYMTH